MAELATYFQSLSPQQPLFVGRQGRDEIEIDEVIGHDLLKPYPRTDR